MSLTRNCTYVIQKRRGLSYASEETDTWRRFLTTLDSTWRLGRLVIKNGNWKRYRTFPRMHKFGLVMSTRIAVHSGAWLANQYSSAGADVSSDWLIGARATLWLAGRSRPVFLDYCMVLKGAREGVWRQRFALFSGEQRVCFAAPTAGLLWLLRKEIILSELCWYEDKETFRKLWHWCHQN